MKTILLLMGFGVTALTVGLNDNDFLTSNEKQSIEVSKNSIVEINASINNKVKTTYQGFANGYYFFSDANDEMILLEQKDVNAVKNYDFGSDETIGLQFEIEVNDAYLIKEQAFDVVKITPLQ